MSENHFFINAKRREDSLNRYIIRYYKDTCLHDDVEFFISKRSTNLARLTDMLINNDFILARYSDPTYPAK